MARVTVEDCLKRIPNRFLLVHTTAKRVRQLREGTERLVKAPSNEDIVAALREIAAGKVFVTEREQDDQPGYVEMADNAGVDESQGEDKDQGLSDPA